MPIPSPPPPETILVVDDDANVRAALSEALTGRGYRILTAVSGEAAVKRLEKETAPVDLVVTDLRMRRISGIDLLKRVRATWPGVDVLLITAFGTVEMAVEALKEGAYDFLTKPLDLTRFRITIDKIMEKRRLERENVELRSLLGRSGVDPVVGVSPAIQEVYRVVDQVAATDATVLVEGESGTGKELVAQAIHLRSLRRDGPLVIVNCGALPATLLENELFGHEREAFTGAGSRKTGRFEQADGGTLFLDEVAEMDRESQAKFLRVLEDGIVHRVGGGTAVQVDVRVVAATNSDLSVATETGRFREDLYYRLNVVSIRMPRLAERSEDIPILAETFLEELGTRHGKEMSLTPRVREVLAGYDWPGNVRELRNALERAVILGAGREIILADLPPAVLGIRTGQPTRIAFDVGLPMSKIEEMTIRRTLEAVGGHRRRAAEILGISLRSLHYKLRRYDEPGAGEDET